MVYGAVRLSLDLSLYINSNMSANSNANTGFYVKFDCSILRRNKKAFQWDVYHQL